jgi:Shikimate kinase
MFCARQPLASSGEGIVNATVILVEGVVGSGKTTVGHLLAAQLGYSFLEGDSLHPVALESCCCRHCSVRRPMGSKLRCMRSTRGLLRNLAEVPNEGGDVIVALVPFSKESPPNTPSCAKNENFHHEAASFRSVLHDTPTPRRVTG